jgi:NAD(P)-dependent dehydrogenase (short-subunit alcohol dehydrogenase family)
VEISGASAVVTGAAGGIGAAVAAALVNAGARVTLVDLDAARVEATAKSLGDSDRVAWHAGDVSTDEGISELLAAVPFGPVTLYVANAGIFRGFGLDASEAEWSASWDVNVMAHVRAARALIPGWLEAGGGCFAVTASAAGLLTQLGSPTYSVTKHAAVGFAEWLAATYGDRGVQVACLTPMGIRTPMADELEAAVTGDAHLGAQSVAAAGDILPPSVAADALLAAITENRFFAMPHESVAQMYAAKAADTDRWLAGMQRLRVGLGG